MRPFFTQDDGMPLLGQEQCRRHTNDAAANYHDAHALRQFRVGLN